MRNTFDDDDDNVASLKLRADDDDREEAFPYPSRTKKGNGTVAGKIALFIVGAGFVVLAAFLWLSQQQMATLQTQVDELQSRLAQVDENARGRLTEISGKVEQARGNAAASSEVQMRMTSQQARLAEAVKKVAALDQTQAQTAGTVKQLQDSLAQQGERLKSLAAQQSKAPAVGDEQLSKLTAELNGIKGNYVTADKLTALSTEIQQLKTQGGQKQAINQVSQDILVVQAKLDELVGRINGMGSQKEFDLFRAQATRNISALQEQLLNLSQKVNGQAR